jgi:tRNA(fMet)-specific endonuclease VapC
MRIALDANAYTDFCSGEVRVVEIISKSERIYIPLIVLAELRAGFQVGTRAKQNERVLNRFLKTPRVRLLVPDEQTTVHYASLYAQLRKEAKPIPTNDLWIAALVAQHNLTLLSRDAHFDNLPQLDRM